MDIIQRLRNHALLIPYNGREFLAARLLEAAASEIEKLRDDLSRMRASLTGAELIEDVERHVWERRYETAKRDFAEALGLPYARRNDDLPNP